MYALDREVEELCVGALPQWIAELSLGLNNWMYSFHFCPSLSPVGYLISNKSVAVKEEANIDHFPLAE